MLEFDAQLGASDNTAEAGDIPGPSHARENLLSSQSPVVAAHVVIAIIHLYLNILIRLKKSYIS